MKKMTIWMLAAILGLSASLPFRSVSVAADNASAIPAKNGWPADKVPAELPPYANGKIINVDAADDGEFALTVAETKPDALVAYLESLKAKGWEVTSDKYESVAKKGPHSVTFVLRAPDGLQINVHTAKSGPWPSAEQVPPFLLQPKDYTVLEPTVSTIGDGAWLYNFTCLAMDEGKARAYMDSLRQNGWRGDFPQLTGKVNWKGESCDMMLEINETVAGNTTFTLNFGRAAR